MDLRELSLDITFGVGVGGIRDRYVDIIRLHLHLQSLNITGNGW